MARENAAAKARRYLCEGRLIVVAADRKRLKATCRGDGAVWEQWFDFGTWRCTCPAKSDACAHLQALRLVTAVDQPRSPK